MTINNNLGEKSIMEKDLINNMLKDVLKEDKLDVLISMINNGLDINDFTYKNLSGLDAIIAYKLDCGENVLSEILKYLLETFKGEYINPSNKGKIANLLLNNDNNKSLGLDTIVSAFADFMSNATNECDNSKSFNSSKPLVFSNLSDLTNFLKDEIFNDIEVTKDDSIDTKKTDCEENSNETLEDKSSCNDSKDIAIDCGKAYVKTSEELPSVDMFLEENEEVECEQSENTSFDILGESNYKVSSISSYVTLENSSTYSKEQFSIQAKDLEDLQNQVNQKIAELNNKHDEKLANSVIELMKNNSQFKKDLLNMMKEAQLKTF